MKSGAAKRKNQSVSQRTKTAKRKPETTSQPIGGGFDQLLTNKHSESSAENSYLTPKASERGESTSKNEEDGWVWLFAGPQEQRDNLATFYKELVDKCLISLKSDKSIHKAISEIFSLETINKILECVKRDPGNSWSRKQTASSKTIRNPKEWAKRWGFDLTKYSKRGSFEASGWRREVGIRRLLWITLTLKETKAISSEMLKSLMENPANDAALMEENASRQLLRIPDSTNALACPTFNVRPLDTQTAYEYAKQVVDFSEKVMAGKYGKDTKEAFQKNGTSIDVLLLKAGFGNPFGHFLVNTSGAASDEVLTQEFHQSLDWLTTELPAARGFNRTWPHPNEIVIEEKHMNRNRLSPRTDPFTREDFERWHKKGVLPYIDLRLAARCDQIKLSVDDMATLLFPDCRDSGKRLNMIKPTKFLADELGKNVTFLQLIPQGYAEVAQKKPST